MRCCTTLDDRCAQSRRARTIPASPTWIDAANRHSLFEIAEALNYACGELPRFGRLIACPVCAARQGDEFNSILTVVVHVRHDGAHGWLCHACNAGNDNIEYVAHALGGDRFCRLPKAAQGCVQRWFERILRGPAHPAVPAPREAPSAMSAFLAASR